MKRKPRIWIRGYYRNVIVNKKKMRKWVSGYWKEVSSDYFFKNMTMKESEEKKEE